MKSIKIQGDSKLVLNQVFGTWEVRAPHLLQHKQRALQLLGMVHDYTWEHIPRASNEVADALANKAIDDYCEQMRQQEIAALMDQQNATTNNVTATTSASTAGTDPVKRKAEDYGDSSFKATHLTAEQVCSDA